MGNLKKYIVGLFLFVFIVPNVLCSYTFASGTSQTSKCSACNSTPKEMQMYINFEVELLGILQNITSRTETFGINTKSGLFKGGLLSLPQTFFTSVIKKLKTDLDSELKATRAINISLVLLEKMAITGIRDSLGSIEILYKDDAFVRDYKLLQEIDMSINDVIWDMGTIGIWKDKVSPDIMQEILTLKTKYSRINGGVNPIFENLSISTNVKNRELLGFLLNLNSTMKGMLLAVGENTPILDSRIQNFEDLYSHGNIIVEINDDYKTNIINSYSCAKRSTCNGTLLNAMSGMVHRGTFSEAFKQSTDTIKDAIKNFTEAYNATPPGFSDKKNSKGTGGLTDRQVELLYTVYGIDAYELTTSQMETFKKNLQYMKNEINPFKDMLDKKKSSNVKNTDIKIKGEGDNQQRQYVNSLSYTQMQTKLSLIFRQTIVPNNEQGDQLLSTMQDIVNNILNEKSNDKEIILVGQNPDMHYFVEIGGIIHSMIRDEIGTKDDDGIVKNLGEVCEYQCSNKGGKCYTE